MKRFFFSLAAVAAIVASCTNKELQPVTPEANGGSYSLKAIISTTTKTSIDVEGVMSWVTGDKIAVYDGDFEEFTLKGEASGAEATFTGDIYYPEDACVAVCPFDIASEVADEMLTVNLPVSYEYDGQSTHAPMIATGFSFTDKEATIKFKHIGGLFKVTYNNIPEEAKYFCFESETNQIAGEFYIEDYTVEHPVIEVGNTPSKGNIVSYTIADDHASSMTFYVPVPVGTFDFNISLRDAENNKIAKSSKTKRGFTIARGEYVEIPAVNMPKKFVENFFSSAATSNAYNCNSSFSTATNRADFDYTWSSTTGTVFNNGIKLGSGSAEGSTTSSNILSDITAGTVFTVKVYAAVWNRDGGKIVVSYNGKEVTLDAANPAITSTTNTYSASDFVNSTDFVFQKADGVNNLTVASSSLRLLIDKIEVLEGGELPKEPQEFSVSTTSLAAAWDETSKTFDITAADVVAWEIVADDGLTLSQDEGNGNATITVTFAENTEETQVRKEIVVSTDYSPLKGESEYTIVLTQAGKPSHQMDGDGSAANPYSVADALYIADNLADNASTAECYVTGTIKTLGTFSSGTYSYTIGTGDDTFEVYKGKDLGNVNFASAEDIAVDQVVVVYGKIKKYVNAQSATTLEMDANNYLYSINGANSVLKSIAVSGAKTSFTQNEEWSFGGTVTASYRGKANADVTSNTTFSGYNTANTGEQTVTASYTENEVTKTAEYTINVVKEGTVQITKVTAVNQFTPGTYIILTYDETGYVPNAVATTGGSVLYKEVTKTGGVINITTDMVWTATGSGGTNGLTFESYENSGKYLWGSDTNNGIRVTDTNSSSGASKVWTLSSNNTYGMMGTFGSSRYLTTYGTQDWRCYTSASSTNKAANFFKVVGWVAPEKTKYTLTINSAENGSIEATVDDQPVVTGAQIEEGKTVKITATPEDSDHEFDAWDVTGATVGASSTETFTMTGDVTVGATFKEKETPGPGPDPDPGKTKDNTAKYTLTPTAGINNQYTGNCDVTVDGITWNVTGNASMTPWRLGGKSISNTDRAVYSKTAYAKELWKVSVDVGAASSITVNSVKLVYSTNADFSNSSEISKAFAANSTIDFEAEFPENCYYKFVFNVTVSAGNNKFVEFKEVRFYGYQE